MNLYLLKPIKAWDPWYDKNFGLVIAARSESSARELAAQAHGDEGPGVWMNPAKTTCVLLTADSYDDEAVILVDCHDA